SWCGLEARCRRHVAMCRRREGGGVGGRAVVTH
ncbi:jg9446, partial [Pararge aegeria aegeria]